MCSLLNNNEPQYITDFYPKRRTLPAVVARAEPNNLHVSHYQSTTFQIPFTLAAPQTWNNFPKPIKDSSSPQKFRKKYTYS
jgi:hypothetical protein